MKSISRKLLTGLAVLWSTWMLSSMTACHTIEGAGQDVSAAGDGVSTLAERARPYD